MRSMQEWLEEYGHSHRHPANKAIHWVCVPAILFSILGLLWLVPVPEFAAPVGPWMNWATLSMVLALGWYVALSPALALCMAAVGGIMLLAVFLLEAYLSLPLWILFSAIFVAAWIGQFVGHRIEGRKPSFFRDLQFLLVGPVWLIDDFLARVRRGYATPDSRDSLP